MRFFYERLETIRNSEVEQNNEEIVQFSWPAEIFDKLKEEECKFDQSLVEIGKMRNEVFVMLYTQEKMYETKQRLKVSKTQRLRAPKISQTEVVKDDDQLRLMQQTMVKSKSMRPGNAKSVELPGGGLKAMLSDNDTPRDSEDPESSQYILATEEFEDLDPMIAEENLDQITENTE